MCGQTDGQPDSRTPNPLASPSGTDNNMAAVTTELVDVLSWLKIMKSVCEER